MLFIFNSKVYAESDSLNLLRGFPSITNHANFPTNFVASIVLFLYAMKMEFNNELINYFFSRKNDSYRISANYISHTRRFFECDLIELLTAIFQCININKNMRRKSIYTIDRIEQKTEQIYSLFC